MFYIHLPGSEYQVFDESDKNEIQEGLAYYKTRRDYSTFINELTKSPQGVSDISTYIDRLSKLVNVVDEDFLKGKDNKIYRPRTIDIDHVLDWRHYNAENTKRDFRSLNLGLFRQPTMGFSHVIGKGTGYAEPVTLLCQLIDGGKLPDEIGRKLYGLLVRKLTMIHRYGWQPVSYTDDEIEVELLGVKYGLSINYSAFAKALHAVLSEDTRPFTFHHRGSDLETQLCNAISYGKIHSGLIVEIDQLLKRIYQVATDVLCKNDILRAIYKTIGVRPVFHAGGRTLVKATPAQPNPNGDEPSKPLTNDELLKMFQEAFGEPVPEKDTPRAFIHPNAGGQWGGTWDNHRGYWKKMYASKEVQPPEDKPQDPPAKDDPEPEPKEEPKDPAK